MYSAQKVDYEEELKLKLPEPKGYKLLIAIPKVEEKTDAEERSYFSQETHPDPLVSD